MWLNVYRVYIKSVNIAINKEGYNTETVRIIKEVFEHTPSYCKYILTRVLYITIDKHNNMITNN